MSGETGDAYVYSGIFSHTSRIHMAPGSSVSMAFRSGNSSYIFEIPMSKLTFKEVPGNSRVTFYVKPKSLVADDYGTVNYTRKGCTPIIESGYLAQRCITDTSFTPNRKTLRRGLSPVMAKYVDTVTIQLSPSLYKKLLGTP